MSMTEPTGTPDGVNASLTQLRDRITRTIAGFSRGQRITLGLAAVAVVGLVLAVSYVQSHGPMAALYTGLSSEDAGVVTKELQSKGVDYQLADGGGTVNVPEDQVYQLRADLADVQLPGSGKVGYGILDNQSITASDFSQQVGYQRAMEGEMSKTIEAMSGIEAATVHLAIPKDQVFALDSEQPSASVMVKTSRTLGSEQVQAITNIVASGIQGMSPDRVSVADSGGHLLASPGGTSSSAGSARQQDSLDSYEGSVSSAIESMLTASFGPGKAKVTVSADLDFDQKSTTNETFESPTTLPGATGPVASAESTKQESYGSDAANTAGILGTNGTPATPTPAANGGYTLDQRDVKYALNHAVETTNSAPGKVNRISVAVMVDEKAISADQVAQVQQLVSAAAGVQVDRGDTVVVNRMPFDTTAQKQMQQQLEARSKQLGGDSSSIMLYAAAGAIALVVMAAAFMVLRRRKKDLRQLQELAEQLSNRHAVIDDVTMANPQLAGGTDGASVDGRFGTAAPELRGVASDHGREERQAVLSELIDNQPDEVAQLLRGWLGDRRAVRR